VTAGIRLTQEEAEEIFLKGKLKLLDTYTNNQTKVKCKCLQCGEIVFPRLGSIRNGEGGCMPCGLRKSREAQKIPQPQIMKMLLENELEAQEPYINANTPMRCKCMRCGKIVKVRPNNIRNGFSGRKQCCSKVAVIPKEEALIRFKKAEFMLLEEYTTSNEYLKVQCMKCGKHSKRSLQSLVTKGKVRKCVWCAGLRRDNSDAVTLMRQAGLEPQEPYRGANFAWKCVCLECGKKVSPSLASIRRGHGCKFCAANVLIEDNEAVKDMVENGYQPLEPYKRNHAKWKMQHIQCGSVVFPTRAQILNGDGGCQRCAAWGIKIDVSSYLYLTYHPVLNANKIGIGNDKTQKKRDRLHRLMIRGWQPFRKWEFASGSKALEVEKKVFKIIREDRGIPVFLAKSDMPKTGGHKETMDADLISLKELEKIINKVIKGLQE